MIRRFLVTGLAGLCLAVALGLVVGPASGAAREEPVRKIVVFNEGVNEAAQDALLRAFNGQTLLELKLINGRAVLLPPKAEAALRIHADVLRVEDDVEIFALAKPTPTPVPQPPESIPWGVDRIDADLAWGTSTGAAVKVAIIDSGIDKDHPDLVANIDGGVNFAAGTGWDDKCGHGTHVAGTVAAVNNAIGVVGTAPGARLYAVRVLDRFCRGYVSDLIAGLGWAKDNGMQVANMSLGLSSDVQSLHDAITKTHNAGVLLVAAAGNSGPADNTVIYPAKYAEVIAVSAITSTVTGDTIANFSSRGPEVDLAAPGVNINSTWNNGGYKLGSGTSMAAPHVAGTAALVIASGVTTDLNDDGLVNNEDVRLRLRQTADNVDGSDPVKDNLYGYGLVDAEEATTGIQTLP